MNLPKFTKLPGAVAVDLDGTLLNSHTQLSVRNRAALEKCIECGIPMLSRLHGQNAVPAG